MIIDTIANASKYYCVHPLFARAFEYIRSVNLSTIDEGRYEIDGNNLKAIVSNKKGMTAAESASKFECHDKHIDIQVCISGTERLGWKPRETCIDQKGEYNADKDVVFYNDAPDMFFELREGQFAIFYPEDVHAPMIGEEVIKKMVIKVKL
jgi:YhcH/YjgK/YiaL family protein